MSPCPNCDFENDVTSLFCGGCGHEIAIECSRCGEINKNQAFCLNCGQVASSDLEKRYTSENFQDPNNTKNLPPQSLNSAQQPLPKPGQLVDLISLSVTAYKKDFKSFLILALINGIPTLLIGIMIHMLFKTELISLNDLQQYNDNQLSEHFVSQIKAIPIWKLLAFSLFIVIGLIANLISIMSIVIGAAQFANGEKVSAIICLNYTLSRLGRLILLSLFLIGLLIIPFILSLLLIGIPILIYLFVRWYFALPSLVLDNTSITGSIQRSWDLVDGRWWITLGTGFVILILMTIPTYSLSLLSSNLNSNAAILILDVLVSTLISPFHAITTGIYFLSLKKFSIN